MMHFPKDKHWFEWNLSCVAVLRPAAVADTQTTVLFSHFQSMYLEEITDESKQKTKLPGSVWLVVCRE